jgi:hypothetical protein
MSVQLQYHMPYRQMVLFIEQPSQDKSTLSPLRLQGSPLTCIRLHILDYPQNTNKPINSQWMKTSLNYMILFKGTFKVFQRCKQENTFN